MKIKPIHTEDDYEAALSEIERLFDGEPGTPDGDKLDVLATLVEAYESEHYPISRPDPIEAIEYHMERLGLTRKDLEPYVGGPSRVSEILNRKRSLTLHMIRNLSAGLGIPISILAQVYELKAPERELNLASLTYSYGARVEVGDINDVDFFIEMSSNPLLIHDLLSALNKMIAVQSGRSGFIGQQESNNYFVVDSATERSIQ